MITPELRRILHVEDDADIREIATVALEAFGGFDVASCAGGEEALARVTDFTPDLLLLDVMMPGRDGPATLAALRALPATAHTPAVFMTAKTQAFEIAAFEALGAIGVITKPFDPATLSEQLRALWERHHG